MRMSWWRCSAAAGAAPILARGAGFRRGHGPASDRGCGGGGPRTGLTHSRSVRPKPAGDCGRPSPRRARIDPAVSPGLTTHYPVCRGTPAERSAHHPAVLPESQIPFHRARRTPSGPSACLQIERAIECATPHAAPQASFQQERLRQPRRLFGPVVVEVVAGAREAHELGVRHKARRARQRWHRRSTARRPPARTRRPTGAGRRSPDHIEAHSAIVWRVGSEWVSAGSKSQRQRPSSSRRAKREASTSERPGSSLGLALRRRARDVLQRGVAAARRCAEAIEPAGQRAPNVDREAARGGAEAVHRDEPANAAGRSPA